jgi:small subunit ribosomal protein S21
MSASSSDSQMKIYVKNNDVNKALRILKKKMLNEGIMKEVRENQYFRSKGEQKRLDAKAGRKRWEKKRIQLEQKFIREERNQIRNNRKKKNVHRPNQSSNQQRTQRNSGNQNNRKPRS